MTFFEAKKVKAVEGIPIEEVAILQDIEQGERRKEERKEEKKERKEEEKGGGSQRKHDYRGR